MIRKRRFAESLIRKRSIKIGGRSSNANALICHQAFGCLFSGFIRTRQKNLRHGGSNKANDLHPQPRPRSRRGRIRLLVTPEVKLDAMAEYKVKQQAEREKMVRLKELRLAAKEKR
jgi:hypothetical protein